MYYGIQVCEGWQEVQVFHKLSTALQLITLTDSLDWQDYCSKQIKGESGLLRVYMYNSSTKDISDTLRSAVEESARTCEKCGRDRQLTTDGWLTCRDGQMRRRQRRAT